MHRRACRPPAGRGSSRAGVPPYDATVVARLRGGRPGRSSARPTWTSSRWAPRPSTPPTARPTTRGTSSRIPGGSGGGSAAARRRLRGAARDRHRHRRLDPPAGGRHRHRRRQADVRRRVALRPRRARVLASTRPARAPAPSSTRRCCTRSSAGTTRWTRRRIDAPVPDVVAAARRADVRGLRIGVVSELGGEGYQAGRAARGSTRRSSCSSTPAPRSSRCPARTSPTRSRPTT